MNSPDTIRTIYRHHLWANLRLFNRCRALTDKQLDASIVGVYGSIRDTLLHIVRAELSYHSRISTGKLYRHPDDAPPMTIEDMIAALQTTGEGLIKWAAKVGENDTVEIDWDGTLRQVPKTIILNQAINHATEHRSQIMSIMTKIGIEPPDVSSWTYFDELEKKGNQGCK
jgi:uncharacterized damage-inducible protein DinB